MNNPGPVGIGKRYGIGKELEMLIIFSKNIGICDFNEVEVLTILEDLRLFSTR